MLQHELWYHDVASPTLPTGEEDVTMALTIQDTSPMNMYINKIAETECWSKCFELEHAHMNIYHA